jgi:hypothetical protein
MWEELLPNGFFELVAKAEAEGASSLYAQIFGTICVIVITFAWWVTLTALIKWTPGKSLSNALLGISTAWIIVIAVRGLSHFVLVEADWDVVWANRVLLIGGQQMTEQMTQAPGSESCIAVSNCYGINQNWRLWWIPSSALERDLPGVHLIRAVRVTHHAKVMTITQMVPKIWAYRELAPSASAFATSSKKPFGRSSSHMPPAKPQNSAS